MRKEIITQSYCPEQRIKLADMRRRQAEQRSDRDTAIALEAIERSNMLAVEKARLQRQNARLMETLHAVAGWPRRLMLPIFEEVGA